jgi:hypothetical protein
VRIRGLLLAASTSWRPCLAASVRSPGWPRTAIGEYGEQAVSAMSRPSQAAASRLPAPARVACSMPKGSHHPCGLYVGCAREGMVLFGSSHRHPDAKATSAATVCMTDISKWRHQRLPSCLASSSEASAYPDERQPGPMLSRRVARPTSFGKPRGQGSGTRARELMVSLDDVYGC